MFNFKSFAVFVVASFLMVPAIFAQSGVVTKDPSGGYVYETTISSLVDQRVYEELGITPEENQILGSIYIKGDKE